jgi:hypothetical protein
MIHACCGAKLHKKSDAISARASLRAEFEAIAQESDAISARASLRTEFETSARF